MKVTFVKSTAAAAASLVVRGQGARLLALYVYNAKGSAQFIQVHNAASLPADNAIPVFSQTMATVANYSVVFPDGGLPCPSGIVICNSSTVAVKTIGSTDCTICAIWGEL